MVDGTIPVYTAGTEGQVVFTIHGAGHSAMTFARITEMLKDKFCVVAWD
jgi:protein phosphatase methylesterase 1